MIWSVSIRRILDPYITGLSHDWDLQTPLRQHNGGRRAWEIIDPLRFHIPEQPGGQ